MESDAELSVGSWRRGGSDVSLSICLEGWCRPRTMGKCAVQRRRDGETRTGSGIGVRPGFSTCESVQEESHQLEDILICFCHSQRLEIFPVCFLQFSTSNLLTAVLTRYLLLNRGAGAIFREHLGSDDIGYDPVQVFPQLVLTCLTITATGDPTCGHIVTTTGALATVHVFRPIALDVLLDRCAADHITQAVTIFGVGFCKPIEVGAGPGLLKDVDKVIVMGEGAIMPYFRGRQFDINEDQGSRILRGLKRTYLLAVLSAEPNPELLTAFDLFVACVNYGMASPQEDGPVQIKCEMPLTLPAAGLFADFVSYQTTVYFLLRFGKWNLMVPCTGPTWKAANSPSDRDRPPQRGDVDS
jgi:hypothetical protein